MSLLDIQELRVQYKVEHSCVEAVNDVSLSIDAGESVALVGETGAGKTTTALSVLRLIASPPGKIVSGRILYEGENLLEKPEAQMRRIRGKQISMIFQDPMTALNPVLRVQDQIAEIIRIHDKCSKSEAVERALDMLSMVGIAPDRGSDYPHQFSGGMKQRVVIAIALACKPRLLLADEPTTALDVTIQAQILEMISLLREKLNTAMLLITHDLGVVADICDKVAIMYAGEIVEFGTLEQVYENTLHPYTKGLFGSLPNLNKKVRRLQPIMGLMPDPAALPKGCKFHPRCPQAMPECAERCPATRDMGGGHMVRCLKYEGVR